MMALSLCLGLVGLWILNGMRKENLPKEAQIEKQTFAPFVVDGRNFVVIEQSWFGFSSKKYIGKSGETYLTLSEEEYKALTKKTLDIESR